MPAKLVKNSVYLSLQRGKKFDAEDRKVCECGLRSLHAQRSSRRRACRRITTGLRGRDSSDRIGSARSEAGRSGSGGGSRALECRWYKIRKLPRLPPRVDCEDSVGPLVRGFKAVFVDLKYSDLGFQRGRTHAELHSSTRGTGYLAAC